MTLVILTEGVRRNRLPASISASAYFIILGISPKASTDGGEVDFAKQKTEGVR